MPLDLPLEQSLASYCTYFRDLGIFDFYRRGDGIPPEENRAAASLAPSGASPESSLARSALEASSAPARTPNPSTFEIEESSIPSRKPVLPQPPLSPPIAPRDRAKALRAIRDEIGDCTRCALAKGRNKIVFGDGDPNARLMFVGEGPGADEDAQGLPFVGRAGQLLNNMIVAMGLKREEVYIANIVKCRPPQNRVPEPEEARTCAPFLFRQIDVIRPQVLVALGSTAALYLLGVKSSLNGLRGRVHELRGAKLIVTYHPAYLLRDPRQKKEAWKDLQLAMAELGLSPSAR